MLGKEQKKKKGQVEVDEKILDVNASMSGNMAFKDPVNLRINGKFEGTLDTRGSLTIGQNANVNAEITGDAITIAGKVKGQITAFKELVLERTADVQASIKTPVVGIEKGAAFSGDVAMSTDQGQTMNEDDVSRYLEIEKSLVLEWAGKGKIPAKKEGDGWKFNRKAIDEWILSEKVK